MILVVGASGQLGSRVARRLLLGGTAVRAVSRRPERLEDLAALGAELVRGDLLHDGWMSDALRDVDQVVVAAHGLVPPDRRNHPDAVDGKGARRLVDAAARAGTGHLVYVSVAGADRRGSAFARTKFATEEHLRRSGLPHTVVRPTVFMENQLLLMLAEPLRATGTVTFYGPGTTPLNWVSAADVADEVVRAVDDPSRDEAVWSVGGPDVLSRLEALAVVEAVLGKAARRKHVPVAGMRLLRGTAGRLNPGLRYLLDLSISEVAPGGAIPADAGLLDRVGRTRVREVVEGWAMDSRHDA
ncbi:MAG TPA: SDR family oxidoreductase [Longimicrobiales bacterium]|nr:SDR family oxidoreductase [Longimicrobiales bacterium]